MTNRERLLNNLNGRPVDRPAVSFYELNGYSHNPDNPGEYYIYNHPSWRGLLELAKNATDKIVLNSPRYINPDNGGKSAYSSVTSRSDGFTETVYKIDTPKGELTGKDIRYTDVDTVWHVEHYIKNIGDIEKYLSLPETVETGELDVSRVLKADEDLGDSGISAIDLSDAIGLVAPLFSMEDFTVFALTENKLMRELLDRAQKKVVKHVKNITERLPGRLYRICGPEYASPPYLPPRLFHEYVTAYDTEIVKLIQKSGGYARIHSHGNLSKIIGDIMTMGPDALDPVEPPPQGDVTLSEIKEKYGKDLVLFGNIELSEIETMETEAFTERVKRALFEGMSGEGRGFVLMPTAAPIGRVLSDRTYRHYEIMANLARDTHY